MAITIERGHWGFCLTVRTERQPDVAELTDILRDEKRLEAWRLRMMRHDLEGESESDER